VNVNDSPANANYLATAISSTLNITAVAVGGGRRTYR
jgi:hypothetical protein